MWAIDIIIREISKVFVEVMNFVASYIDSS